MILFNKYLNESRHIKKIAGNWFWFYKVNVSYEQYFGATTLLNYASIQINKFVFLKT